MRFFRWLAGFVEQHTAQSSTRAIAFLFAFAAVAFAFYKPDQGGTLTILVGGAATFALQRGAKGQTAPPLVQRSLEEPPPGS